MRGSKGKTYEEIYGIERATEIRLKRKLANQGKGFTGKKHSEETREKIKTAHIGKKRAPYKPKELKFKHTCRVCGQDFMGADVRGVYCSDCKKPKECLCGCGKLALGKGYCPGHHPNTQSVESHKKQGKALLGQKNPAKRADVRKKISEALLVPGVHGVNTHPEVFQRLGYHLATTNQSYISKPEKRLGTHLTSDWIPQYRFGWYLLDFADPVRKIAIEFNGCFWHCCSEHFPIPKYKIQQDGVRRDKAKSTYLRNRGWELIIVWECNLEEFINDYLHKAS